MWLFGTSALAFGLVVRVVIPSFGDAGVWSHGNAFHRFAAEPWKLPLLAVTPSGKIETIVLWLAPFAMLPLLSPAALLAVPVALERLLSDVPTHWGHGFHYSAPLAPILALAAGDGLARLIRRPMPDSVRRRVTLALPSLSILLSLVLPGHQPLLRTLTAGHYRPIPTADTALEALSLIPAGAAVVAQAAIASHLSHRDQIFVLDADAPDAAFVIACEDVDPWPQSRDALSELIQARLARGYSTAFSRDGWIVLRRSPERRENPAS
jgi:uncharacterized membrane protein